MSITEQLVSISRAHAIAHGAKVERTLDEQIQDLLFAEPLLKEADKAVKAFEQDGDMNHLKEYFAL